jgi:hypothetical protein
LVDCDGDGWSKNGCPGAAQKGFDRAPGEQSQAAKFCKSSLRGHEGAVRGYGKEACKVAHPINVESSEGRVALNELVACCDGESKQRENAATDPRQTAFPTMLILDENNRVVKIHTGFNGPATSQYEIFKRDFEESIDKVQEYLKTVKENRPISGHSDVSIGFWLRACQIPFVSCDKFWWDTPDNLIHNKWERFDNNDDPITFHYVKPHLMFFYHQKYNKNYV